MLNIHHHKLIRIKGRFLINVAIKVYPQLSFCFYKTARISVADEIFGKCQYLSRQDNYFGIKFCFQNEVLKLKNEVAQLKQLLLAHKDCPVTQMQQRQSQNWQVFHGK